MPPYALKRAVPFTLVSPLKCKASLKGGSLLSREVSDPVGLTELGGSVDSNFALKGSKLKSGYRLKASYEFSPLISVIRPITDTLQLSELGQEIFTDDFNRADGALGGSWVVGHVTGSHDIEVVDNAASLAGSGTAWAYVEGPPIGVDVSVTVLDGAVGHCWLYLNLDDTFPTELPVGFGIAAIGAYGLTVGDGLVFTALLDPDTLEPFDSNPGDRLRVTDDGVTMTAYINGRVPIREDTMGPATETHSSSFESGKHGFMTIDFGAESFTDHSGAPFTDHADDPYLPH